MSSLLHRSSNTNRSKAKMKMKESQCKVFVRSVSENRTADILQKAKKIYFSQTNMQQAIQLFEQYLALHQDHDESLYLSAVAYLHLDKPKQAIQKLERLSDSSPNKCYALLLTAMAYNKIGEAETSLARVNECLRKKKHFEQAICFRGKILMAMKQFQKAEEDYLQATQLENASFLSYVGLADCLRAEGMIARASPLYERALTMCRSSQQGNKDPSSFDNNFSDILVKLCICLYETEQYEAAIEKLSELSRLGKNCSSELFYYLGQSYMKVGQKEKGILNLEYCLRVQTHQKLMRKAYKILLMSHVEDHLFYEAVEVVKLGTICGIDLPNWANMVSAFMAIIKGHYEEGVAQLTSIYDRIKAEEERKKNIQRSNSHRRPPGSNRFCGHGNQFVEDLSQSFSPKLAKQKQPVIIGKKESSGPKIRRINYFSTKSVFGTGCKIASKTKCDFTRLKLDSGRLKCLTTFKKDQERGSIGGGESLKNQCFTNKEKELLYPLLLLFKGYGQFFMNNFLRCLDTYEEYDNYLKDVFGKESDIQYNKTLCEALLMSESDMPDEALLKFTSCIDLYYDQCGKVAAEPLLYKVLQLIRIASGCGASKEELAEEREKMLQKTLTLVSNYQPAICNHPMTFYYKGMLEILLRQFADSRLSIEKSLKLSEDYSWKLLYLKGISEFSCQNYYEAIKEFTAGLILESRPELYIGRAVSFLLFAYAKEDTDSIRKQEVYSLQKSAQVSKKPVLSDRINKNKDSLIENCFDDLQKYIETEPNQECISVWVSKILFYNNAYGQAARSLTKVRDHSKEVLSMLECIELYDGEFEEAGLQGKIVKSALDGQFLSLEQKILILRHDQQGKILKNYEGGAYGYLSASYEKWLVVLHLYMKDEYPVLLKYLQKEIFSVSDQATEIHLRYDVVVVYLLMEETNRAATAARGLLHYPQYPQLHALAAKVCELAYESDECFSDLKEISTTDKLLSSYLPFRPVDISGKNGKQRVFVKLSVPFPSFPKPSMRLTLSNSFLCEELRQQTNIEKKIDVPWIKKIKEGAIQFTEKIEESELDNSNIESKSSNDDECH